MPTRIAACDLGKVSASMVVGHLGEDGALVVDDTEYVVHEGQPFAAFVRWYLEKDVASCAALGATGVYAEQLKQPAQVVPEDVCQEAALGRLDDLPDTLNLVSIGGRGYSALSRLPAEGNGNGAGTAFAYRYLENDKCSSGTGENIQKMVARFGMTLDDADGLALSAETLIPITARCSVFAKSEMTHYANQGKAASELFRGFFTSVARNAAALLARNGVEAPVYLIGGCAGIASIVRALTDTLAARWLCWTTRAASRRSAPRCSPLRA